MAELILVGLVVHNESIEMTHNDIESLSYFFLMTVKLVIGIIYYCHKKNMAPTD